MREYGQGDVSVPARIAADLVLVQAALALGGLEAGLDRPPCAGDAHEFLDVGAFGRVGQVVGELAGAGEAAAGQYPAAVGGRIGVEDDIDGQLGGGPVIEAWPLGPVPAGERLPGLWRCLRDELVDAPGPGQRFELLGFGCGSF